MVFGVFFILSLVIIAGAILFGIYMWYCSENNIKMFTDPENNATLYNVMKEIEKLRKEIQEMNKTK